MALCKVKLLLWLKENIKSLVEFEIFYCQLYESITMYIISNC